VLALAAAAACRRGPEPPARAPAPVSSGAPAPVSNGAPAPMPAPATTTVAPSEEDLVEEAPETNPTSETVKIKLVAEPARKARVSWGRKDLGFAPLEIERPRGSGPLDLLVVAPGALPLHTRVYTDRDDKLALRLYGEGEAPNLLGYHAPSPTPPQNSPKKGAVADAAKRKRAP
jgi:hypothetical protein